MVWYDQWSVYSIDGDGVESVVAHGKAQNTEEERLYKRADVKRVRARIETKGRSINLRQPPLLDVPAGRQGSRGTHSSVTPLGVKRKPSRTNPRREGIMAMVERAKRKLAEDEFIPPMGSDPHS